MSDQDLAPQRQNTSNNKEAHNYGIFDWLLSLFSGAGDPEKEKKKLLKQIGKELKKQRVKFYKPKGEEALPGMAKFFYEIYKTLGPAQNLIQHAQSSQELRAIVIESYLTDEQRDLLEHFDESYFREQLKSMNTKELAESIKEDMVKFYGAFDSAKIRDINNTYNLLIKFLNFVHFDYFFLLKKFDSRLAEGNFTYNPKFETISGEYIIDDLKDFLEIVYTIEKDENWDKLFNVLKAYKGVEVVPRDAWNKVLNQLESVKKSNVFLLIVRHIDKDPYYKSALRGSNERIVEGYLNKIKTQTEVTIQKILKEQRSQKVDKLLNLIFGTSAVVRTKNYTEKANINFQKKMLPGYTYTSPLNYLKAFLLDYYKRDVREIVQDVLLVRSNWTTNIVSQQISEAFHEVLQISEKLIQFDDSLGEEGELGAKLKKAMIKAERDKSMLKYAKQTLTEINNQAQKLINEAAQHLINMGKHLKTLLEDYEKKNPEIILNWKEIDSAAEGKLKERMLDIYKKIYYFVQLLQLFVKK